MNSVPIISDYRLLPTEDTARFAVHGPYDLSCAAWLDDTVPCADSFTDRPKAVAAIFSEIFRSFSPAAAHRSRSATMELEGTPKGDGKGSLTAQKDRMIKIKEVTRRIGFCPRSVYRKCACGELPYPIKSGRSSHWLESDVDAFIEKRKKQREEKP